MRKATRRIERGGSKKERKKTKEGKPQGFKTNAGRRKARETTRKWKEVKKKQQGGRKE